MSGVFSGIPALARRTAATGAFGKAFNVLTMGAYRKVFPHLTDTQVMERNPTTPLSNHDSLTSINDPLDLTGERHRDAAANAAAEAAANVKPPLPLPDTEEILRARRLAAARSRSASGRAATILGDFGSGANTDALGG